MEGDDQLRASIQANLGRWVSKLGCGGDAVEKLKYKMKFVKQLKAMPIAIKTDAANEQHYEVDTDFFLTILGDRLKYSSCYFSTETSTLEEAEDAMLEMVCQRAHVQDGLKIMDLGCGWGVTGLYIVEKYPNCNVTCISNSSTQAALINKRAADRGFANRLKCITADANVFTTKERYDRIISVEMFEHMKNYENLFTRVSSWLKADGYLFTHILCHREYCYHFKEKADEATGWMAKHFFSGGTMPSSDLFLYFQKDLRIVDHWNINGAHYSKTLEAWLERLDANRDRVYNILHRKHGDDTDKQIFNWRMFFIYCSEVFNYDGGNEWLVSHHLFQKNPNSKL